MEDGVDAKKLRQDRHNCCVPQCSDVKNDSNHLHRVPKDELDRQKWAIAIKTGKKLGAKMTVCSKHFKEDDYIISMGTGKLKRLKPGVVPSQNLPARVHDRVLTSPLKRKRQERAERVKKRAVRVLSFKTVQAESAGGGQECLCGDAENGGGDDRRDVPVINAADAATLKEVGVQVDFDNCVSVVANVVSCDRRLISATGIHSVGLLNSLVQCCDEIAPESSLKKFSLCTRDRIVLCMMKIKLNISFLALAAIFDLSNSQTVANYFYDTVMVLSRVLKSVVFWPEKEDILKNMPRSFSKFRSTRAILDAYEIPVEKPKCIRCRIRLYSHYKKNFTAKVMMVCSPSGLICLCAGAFGGRASDKVVTKHTKVYEKCDPGDALMVDKGFAIDDECKDYMVNLIRPPFQRNKKYSKSESVQCAKIARARVHVERVIQRIREFELLRGKIPWNICPYLDSLVVIASGLVNLSNPIMALDKY